jgi:dienelactone hydrolase
MPRRVCRFARPTENSNANLVSLKPSYATDVPRFFLGAALGLLLLTGCGGENGPAGGGPGQTSPPAVPSAAERQKLLAYEASQPVDVREVGSEEIRGMTVSDIQYSAGGRRVPAYLVAPQTPGPHAAILYVNWYAPGEENSNRREFLDEAAELAERGVVSILPEILFPWAEGLTADVQADRELVVRSAVEARRALDVLLEREDVDPERIGFVGHDYGAMYGSLLAAADRRPKAYALLTPDATWVNWFVKYLLRGRANATEYQQAFAPLDPASAVAEAAPAALFFQFAQADVYVPSYIVERLVEAASEPKRVARYGGGHELDEQARSDRIAWLAEQLELER